MSDPRPPARSTRRDFLRNLGLISGGLAASVSPLKAAPTDRPLRAGLVVPRSALFPELGERITAGFRLGLARAGRQGPTCRIDLVPVPVAALPTAVAAGAARSLEQDRVDLVIALVNDAILDYLTPVVEAHGTPLLGLTVGADAPESGPPHPLVFLHSLELWSACRALAAWSCNRLGRRGMVASSFYESGFDHLNAFRSGCEEAGGELLRLQVTDTPGQPNRLAAFLQEADRLRPDWVAAFYSGEEACHFFLLWQRLGLAGRVPLVGPAFLVEERLLDRHGPAAAGVRSALSWSPSLNVPENLDFVRAYQAAQHHEPDAFALLGYEAAGLLARAASRAGRFPMSAGALAEALRSVDYRGPRGECRLDGTTPPGRRSVYLRQVAGGGCSLHQAILEELPPAGHPQLAAEGDGPRTGWLNPYLCL